jgi:hypothetical protein
MLMESINRWLILRIHFIHLKVISLALMQMDSIKIKINLGLICKIVERLFKLKIKKWVMIVVNIQEKIKLVQIILDKRLLVMDFKIKIHLHLTKIQIIKPRIFIKMQNKIIFKLKSKKIIFLKNLMTKIIMFYRKIIRLKIIFIFRSEIMILIQKTMKFKRTKNIS